MEALLTSTLLVTMAEIGGKQRPAPEFYFNRQQTGLSVGQEYGPTMEAQGD